MLTRRRGTVSSGRRRGVALLSVASLALAPLAVMTAAHAAPPANDNWENATRVTALQFRDKVDTTEATKDAAEVGGRYRSNSVWYHVRLSDSGRVFMSTRGTDYFPHMLRVFHADAADDAPDEWTFVGGDSSWRRTSPAAEVVRLKADEHYFVMIGNRKESDGGAAKIVMRRPARFSHSLAQYGELDKVDGSAILLGTMRATRPVTVEMRAKIRQLVDGEVVSGSAYRELKLKPSTEPVPWRLRISSRHSFAPGPVRVVSSSLRFEDQGTLVGTQHFERSTVTLR